jgi:PAS domain S-box-containing protein
VINEGEVAELMEQKMIRSTGEVFDVEIMAAPLTVNNQTVALIHIQDIKERKAA